MSRVHDALRKAEQYPEDDWWFDANGDSAPVSVILSETAIAEQSPSIEIPWVSGRTNGLTRAEPKQLDVDWRNVLPNCKSIPFRPAPETHLIDLDRPHEVPAEEFRSLRTRLNHLQSQQDLHSIVMTSASPAEGKTFTAVNLALAQSQLETPVLLADLDLRRPVVHNLFQCERAPGFSDFISGSKPLEECIRRIEGTNLYFLPAGSHVKNPLEVLNMRHVKHTLEGAPEGFQLGHSRYSAAAVFGRCESAFHLDGRHIDGRTDRVDHIRQRDTRHADAMRKQRPWHRGERRARWRTLQQVHLLLLEDRRRIASPATSNGGHCRQGTGAYMIRAVVDDSS